MPKVVIAGPNLRDQSKGQIHVHAPGCRDLTKVARKEPEYRNAYVEDVASRQELVELIYEDQMDEWERSHPGDTLDWREFDDIYLFPCCDKLDLPDLSPVDDAEEADDDDDDDEDPYDQAATLASKHGASDGEQTAGDAITKGVILGYLDENIDEELMEEASSDDLDRIATAYVEAFIDSFTEKAREALQTFLEVEDD